MIADAELLRRYVASRSEPAFAAFVARHLNLVYFAALRRVNGNTALAEEIAQHVFTLVARDAAALARHTTITGWLYTTTRNAAAKALRAEQVRQRLAPALAVHLMQTQADEAAGADWERLRPVIDESLEKLNTPEREAVLLRFFEGRAFAEIGSALDVSEDAARRRVERALGKLQALLVRRGVTSTGAALAVALTQQGALAAPAGVAASVASAAFAAGAASGTTTGLFFLMSTSKITSGAAVLALIVATATIGYEWRSGSQEKAALAAERREVLALARRTEAAATEAKAAHRPSSPGAEALTARVDSATVTEEEVRGPFGPVEPGSRARGRALMTAYPEIQRLVTDQKRASVAARYQKLYEELALTPAQIDAFERVQISGVSTSIGGDRPGGTMTFDAAPAMPDEEKRMRLREILGERGYRRLQEFDASPSPRDSRVAKLASQLYFTDTPLTAEQGARLQEVFVAGHRTGGRDQPPAEYWAAVRTQAGAFLAAPQLAALGNLQVEDEYYFARTQNQRLRTTAGAAGRK